MRSLGVRSKAQISGFTLLEFLIFAAIVAIVFAFLAPILLEQKCNLDRKAVEALLHTCEIAISQQNVQAVLDCLQKADDLIKKLPKDCLEKYRTALEQAANMVNDKIDEFRGQTSVSKEDSEKLEKAKIKIPPKT